MKLRKNGAHPAVKSDMRFWILCVCFLLGMAAAYPARRSISTDALAQLGAYVQSYAQLADGRSQQPVSVLSAAAAYLRYPLLAFLFGLSAAGVALIPLLCAAQGFFLSFSVCCFAAALGRDGVLLALAALGLRCLFVHGSTNRHRSPRAAVSVCTAVYAVPGRCRFCPGVPRHAASAAPQTGAELADAAVLCVCASDRYGGGVRHCTKIFCAYFGAYRLKKERGEGI